MQRVTIPQSKIQNPKSKILSNIASTATTPSHHSHPKANDPSNAARSATSSFLHPAPAPVLPLINAISAERHSHADSPTAAVRNTPATTAASASDANSTKTSKNTPRSKSTNQSNIVK